MNRTLTTLAIATLGLFACASYPKPTDRLVASQASIRGAEEAGATRHPQAALQIRLAQEEIAQARKLMEEGENERADYVLMRAKADADLALAMAHTSKSLDSQESIEEKAKSPL